MQDYHSHNLEDKYPYYNPNIFYSLSSLLQQNTLDNLIQIILGIPQILKMYIFEILI